MPHFKGLELGQGWSWCGAVQVLFRSSNPWAWPGAWEGCPSGAQSSQVYLAHSFDIY